MMHQVVYISSANKAFEEPELEALLQAARRNNGRSGVTGILLYDDYSFLQVLEGAEQDVQRTVARIQRDPRHSGMTVVQDQAIVDRDFSDWSMAYAQADSADFDRLRQARKLDRDFMRSLSDQISQVVGKTFVRCFGDRPIYERVRCPAPRAKQKARL